MSESKLRVNLIGDASSLDRSLKIASARLDTFGKKISDVGKDLSLKLTLPIVAAGGAAIKMASDMEESQNKVRVAFGDSARSVEAFAKTTLDSFGIAESSALDMTALFGDMATGMGVSQSEAANLSTKLVGLAGDLSSFKNINIEEVTTALSGVFTGETESLKRLGIVMTEVNLEQFAMQQGIQKSVKEMTQQEKIMLRLQYIFSVTKNAQGDFARTQDGAANQTRKLQQSLKELAAEIGENLLPKYTKIITKLNEYVKQFKDADEKTQNLIITIGAFVAATPPVLIALGAIAKGMAAVSRAARYLASEKVLGRLKKAILGTFGAVAASATVAVLALDELTSKIAPDVGLFERIKIAAQGLVNPLTAITGLMGAQVKNSPIAQLEKDISDFEFDMLMEEADALDAFIESVNKPKDKPKPSGKVIDMDQLEKDIDEFADLMAYGEAVAAKHGIAQMDSGDSKFAYTLAADEAALKSFANTVSLVADQVSSPMDQVTEKVKEMSLNVASVAQQMGTALFTAIANGGNAIAALGNVIIGVLGDLLIQMGTAAVAASKLAETFAIPIVGAAAGVAAIALGTLFKGLASKMNSGGVAAFANGGIVSAPTLGLMGEYAGARSNPEVIAPLDRLQSMLGFGRNDVNVTGQFRLDGQDLVVAFERASNTRKSFV